MKKNLYYRTVFKRSNVFKEGALAFFMAFCSWPRLLLEVFVRKNFGERYFSFSTAMFIAGILALLPLIYNEVLGRVYGSGLPAFIFLFGSWYGYLAWFIYACLQRREEIKRLPSVFDFGRFSLSTGEISPRFREIEIGGERVDIRTIETLLEPGLFAVVGISLWVSAQPIGIIIFISSIFYSLSYMAAYRQGDHALMDKIDEMICNEEMVNIFVEGQDPSETRGVSYYGRRPADPETRRRLVDAFMEADDVVEAV
ncbi:hypothetical protein [Runella aurantiaca]|uniref:Uncharacterized protein n=1 Tax=Runella aurantiaca TaxID=2282308 RepID=A0A369IFL9_9BACT|nr:hypothetical protein [Runella aurantiaca]RDB07842.1 hypothetical protein DVG78_01965 [Runella aurantiaca]